MPIFDKDISLFSEPLKGMPEQPEVYTGKALPDVPVFEYQGLPDYKPMFNAEETSGDVYDFFAKNRNKKTDTIFGPSFSELKQNQRYDFYKPGVDYEDIYGRSQSWYSKIGNSLAKTGIGTVGRFAQSFFAIPDLVGAIKDRDFSKLSGQGTLEEDIDVGINNLENKFPNYYSKYETDHPFMSMIPFTEGFANFIGDKLLKNLSFTVGSIGGAVAQAAIVDAAVAVGTEGVGLLGTVPAQFANIVGRASLGLSKIFSGTNRLEKVLALAQETNRVGETVLNLEKLVRLTEGKNVLLNLKSAAKQGLALYTSAATESGVESRNLYNETYNDLVEKYKQNNFGIDPKGEDLAKIKEASTAAMNTGFAFNLGIHAVSNTVQFGGILKSFNSAKNIETALGKLAVKEGTIDVMEKAVPKTLFDKVWNVSKVPLRNMLTEGVYEEGGQFAIEKGVYDYYTNKYNSKNKKSELNDIVNSIHKGLSEQFTSQEGIENMVIGGLSAILTGAGTNLIEKKLNKGRSDLDTIINKINDSNLSGALSERFEDTSRSMEIAAQMKEAAATGNIFKYKNLKADLFFTKVMQRVKMGMHDVTIDQLNMLRELPKEQFEETFGTEFTSDNKQTVDQYINRLIDRANEIKDISETIDRTFTNPFTYIQDPKSKEDRSNNLKFGIFENWKLDIKNFSFSKENRVERLNDIQTELTKINPLLSNALVGSLLDKDQLKDLSESYSQDALIKEEGLDALPSSERAQVKSDIKKLRTMSEKINMSLTNPDVDPKLFEQLLNLELNNRDFSKAPQIGFDKIGDVINYGNGVNDLIIDQKLIGNRLDILASEGGFKKYFEDKEKEQKDLEEGVQDAEVVAKDGVPIFKDHEGKEKPVEVGREYENSKLKLVKPIKEGSKYKVIAPDGKTTYFDKRQEALDFAKELNADISDLSKIKVLALNEDGTIKIEDANGNIQNIKLEDLAGYKSLETKQETLAKSADQIAAEQNDIEKSSATVVTDSSGKAPNEGKLKDSSILFHSTTSESEARSDASKASPHIKRSRIFLNNIFKFKNRGKYKVILITPNNAAAAGLEGIVQMSYGYNPNETTLDELVKKLPADLNPLSGSKAFLAQVYVYQEGKSLYFVNEKGEKVGKVGKANPDILSNVVFQTMPSEELTYDDGVTPKFRAEQQEAAELELARYKEFRKDKFKETTVGGAYDFEVSRGIPREGDVIENNPVSIVLGDISDKLISGHNGLLEIVTTGKVEHKGQLLNFPIGAVIMKYEDVLVYLNNKKLTDKQVKNIYAVIEALGTDMTNMALQGQQVRIPRKYSNFLQDVLYWKSKADTVTSSQIGIDAKTMSLRIGDELFKLSEISENKAKVQDALSNAYFNVNNTTLKEGVAKPFLEYVVDKEGNLSTIQWKNYQQYLLSDKYPDGKNRSTNDIPLSVRAAAPTEGIPYVFEQKYSYITDDTFEFPQVELPKKEEAKPVQTPVATTEKKYKLDGSIDELKLGSGKVVKFTGVYEGDNLKIKIVEDETFNDIVKNNGDAIRQALLPKIESGEIEDISNEGVVIQFLSDVILRDINQTNNKQEEVAQPVVEEKIEETPAPTPTPVSDIEAKKADIERDEQGNFVPKKYTLNARGENPAPNISLSAIKDESFGGEKPTNVKQVKLLEIRGRNSEGVTVGKVWIQLETGESYDAEVFFNDAELAALEAPKSRKNVKPINKNNNFRRVGVNDVEKMTDSDIEAFKKWHAENIPNIPFEILDQMIRINDNEYAWGVFENGVAKFVRGGLKGTEYHEVFEGIWNNLLTETERNDILNEFRKKEGKFIDRETGKEYSYSDPMISNELIKERIADDFADYRLGKLKASSLKGKIKEFFKRIMDFFKSFIAKKTKEKSLKEKLFEAIDKGELKERPNIGRSDLAPQYRKIPGLSEAEISAYVDDIIANMASIIYGDTEYKKDLLFNPDKIGATDVIGEIKERYIESGQYDFLGEQRWKDVLTRAKEKLRTVGATFKELDEQSSINDEERNHKDYVPETFSTDWKGSSTKAVRFSVATLLARQPLNQTGAKTLQFTEPLRSQEIASEDENLTAEEKYETGGLMLVNYNRVFATLLDKLSNTTSISELSRKLVELAEKDSTYVAVLKRLGADLNVRNEDGSIKQNIFKFDQFENEDWEYFNQFYLTFTRNKPDALIQYVNNKDVYTNNANIFSTVKDTVDGWIYTMKSLSSDANSWITYNKAQKIYKIDSEKVKSSQVKTPEQMVEFLAKLGIDFPIDVYNKLSKKKVIVGDEKISEQQQFAKAIASIIKYLGSNNELISVRENTLGISGPLRTLAKLHINITNPNQDPTYFGVEGQRIGSYTENNATSLFENDFNESKTLTELLEKRPELKGDFSKNSQVLKEGGLFFDEDGNRIANIKLLNIQGTENQDTGKNKSTTKLTLGERFVQEINQNINGNYYILVPGDGSTEWMMNLGNVISFDEIENDTYKSKLTEIFKGYLLDEVNLALHGDNKTLTVKNKSKQLRFMREILDPTTVKEIEDIINGRNATFENVEKYINKNIKSINSAIDNFLTGVNDELFESLLAYGQIELSGEGYKINKFDTEFLRKNDLDKTVSKEQLDNFFKFINLNYIINNIEYHKFIFGDPYQFNIKENGNLDETKRIKSFLSPRRRLFDSPNYNNFLNDKYNTVKGIELDSTDPTHHEFKGYTTTVTLDDVEIRGSISMMPNLSKELKKQFDKVTESDAMSIIEDNTWREVKIKAQQWSPLAEEWHQWQMAYTRNKLSKKGLYTYKNTTLEKLDAETILKKEPKFIVDVIKPTVSGNKNNATQINNVVDKMSQMPIYYSMVEGTNLEELYLKMKDIKKNRENRIGYVVFQTGRKVGSEGNNSVYNKDTSFNENAFENTIEIPWKSYGILVDTATQKEKEQPRGSQLTKIASIDLFENGVAESAEVQKKYDRNKDALDNLNDFYYDRILNSLGVIDLGGVFSKPDGEIISATLVQQMLRQNVSENLKDTIKLDEETGEFLIPFEASPSYNQIRSIIYAIVNKYLISPKMSGAPHVQVATTMFETGNRNYAIKKDDKWMKVLKTEDYKKLSEAQQEYAIATDDPIKYYNELPQDLKSTVVLTDDNLKFYTKEEPWCEVMLPAWFKNKLAKGKLKNYTDDQLIEYLNDTEEGRKILTGIAFRIPTQALSSVERFRVKAFLPSYMGYTVVVPSEITTKAGSDFDIDKLNMYLKSVYVDTNGDIRLIEYKGTKEETLKFYNKLYTTTIQSRIYDIEDKEEFRSMLFEILQVIEKANVEESYNLEEIFTSQQSKFFEKYRSILESIIDQSFDEGLSATEYISKQQERLGKEKDKLNLELFDVILKESFVNSMYKKALENEYYDSLYDLLDAQDFERSMTPVGDAGLENTSKELDNLRGYNESSIKGRLLNRKYMTTLRHAFVTGKRWVGIVATNITGHSIKQKSKVYLDFSNTINLSETDQRLFKDFEIAVPHNTVDVDGQTYPSLSGLKTADGKDTYISDRFSGYATSVVDIANNPFIVKVIQSENIISTFMFLEAIGAGETGVMFLNQPIIDEYMKLLDKQNTKSLKNISNIETVKSLFPTTGSDLFEAKIDVNIDSLKNNIKEYYTNEKLDLKKNAEQHKILDEFIKYSILADQLFEYNQSLNYDTTRMTSGDFLYKKNLLTEKVKNNSIIRNSEEVLEKTHIGKLAELLNRSNDAIGVVLKLESREIRAYIEPTLKRYASKQFMSAGDYERLSNLIRNSFLDYVIQTTTYLNKEIEPLLLNPETNIGVRLKEFKEKYPDVKLLQDLEVVPESRQGGAVSLRLKVNVKGDPYSENMYVGMMRELRDYNTELNGFYNDLINTAILQGSAQSAISIRNIIPLEDYSAKITPVINQLNGNISLDGFNNAMFERNNFLNNLIFTTYNITNFQEARPTVNEDGSIVRTFSSGSFLGNELSKVRREDRSLLAIGRRGNSMARQADFLKVPRITYNDELDAYIDVKTGKQITAADFKKMKDAGSTELYDNLYYKKVYTKDDFGEEVPLTRNGVLYYTLMNVYGDSYKVSEYPELMMPSDINNGSVKINQELTADDVLDYFEANKKTVAKAKEEASEVTPSKPAVDLSQGKQITYTPTGRSENVQTYTIIGKDIYNKKGQRVFGSQGKDRNRIFANLAVKEGRAVVVEYKDRNYVVNNQDKIISVATGDIMNWGEENGDRKNILAKAREKFEAKSLKQESIGKQDVDTTEKDLQEYINKYDLEEDKYNIVTVDGKKMILNKTYLPKNIKSNYSVMYFPTALNLARKKEEEPMIIARAVKKIVVPGYEDLDLVLDQLNKSVIEVSTGFYVGNVEKAEQKIKEELKQLFDKKDIYEVLSRTNKFNYSNKNIIATEENLVSLPSDQEILDSVDFKRFAIGELEKNPKLEIEQILEYFKKCGNG